MLQNVFFFLVPIFKPFFYILLPSKSSKVLIFYWIKFNTPVTKGLCNVNLYNSRKNDRGQSLSLIIETELIRLNPRKYSLEMQAFMHEFKNHMDVQ